MTQLPDLSIVVVTLVGPAELRRCLSALAAQSGAPSMEVIVPTDETLGDVADLISAFPDVCFTPLNGRRTYAQLRAAGVRQARGGIVAVTEDHCLPRPDWAAQIIAAHRRLSHTAVGGAVEKTGSDTALNWAVYLLDYLRYAPPLAEGPVPGLTDLNVTYKRAGLDAIADVWRDEFHEPDVHGALEARGEPLWLDPHIVVEQQRSLRLGHALWDRYAFGRLFGSTRVASAGGRQRLIYLLMSPLLPLLLVGRLVAGVAGKRRYTGPFLRALPLVILLALAWGWGEFVGYATGRAETTLTAQTAAA